MDDDRYEGEKYDVAPYVAMAFVAGACVLPVLLARWVMQEIFHPSDSYTPVWVFFGIAAAAWGLLCYSACVVGARKEPE